MNGDKKNIRGGKIRKKWGQWSYHYKNWGQLKFKFEKVGRHICKTQHIGSAHLPLTRVLCWFDICYAVGFKLTRSLQEYLSYQWHDIDIMSNK